jgi:hypothetical protein
MIEVGLKHVLHNQAHSLAMQKAKRLDMELTDEMVLIEQERLWIKWSKAE